MGKYGFRSEFLNDLQSRNVWEIGRFPAYLPDDACVVRIMKNRNMVHYVSCQGGVWLATHAGSKSLLCDFENMNNRTTMFDIKKLQHIQNPSCNTKSPKGKRHPNRKDYDQSYQEDPSC